MNNIVFITRQFNLQYTGGAKIREDMVRACQRAGIRIIRLSGEGMRYFLSLVKLRLDGIDYVLLLYPNVPTIRATGYSAFLKNLMEISLLWIKKKQFWPKVILFVQDLPIEQMKAMRGLRSVPGNRWIEGILFAISDIIGVIGPEMEETILQYYPAVKPKIVYYTFPPYFGHVVRRVPRLEQPIRVAFVGDLLESRVKGVIDSINEVPGIQYNFYGPHGEWLGRVQRLDVRYAGAFSPEEIGTIISQENHIGLLLYDPTNEDITRYMSMAITIKFMTYIFSGLPVITYSRYKNIANLIINYQLGWIFDKPTEIPHILLNLDSNSYSNITKNVIEFAESILAKDYFGQFIKDSVKKLSYNKKE